jgi:hypothetical protein
MMMNWDSCDDCQPFLSLDGKCMKIERVERKKREEGKA